MERDGYAMRSFMTTMQSWVIPADVNQCQFTDLLLGGPLGREFSGVESAVRIGDITAVRPAQQQIGELALIDVGRNDPASTIS